MQHSTSSWLMLLGWTAACGSAPGTGSFEGEGQPPEPVGSVARGPACSFYPCVDLCGERVAVAPVESPLGFEEAGSGPWLLRRGAPLAGGRVLTINGLGAEIRDATDFALLGRVPMPAYESAAIENVALLQGRGGAIAALDVTGQAPSVRSWWFRDTENEPYLGLVGAAAGHFLIRTENGLSIVDVVAGEPRELSCFRKPADRDWWNIVLAGDTLAIAEASPGAEPELVRLHRITSEGPVEVGTAPMAREGPIGGADSRISITWRSEQHLSVWDLAGDRAVEVSTIAGNFPQSDQQSLGGFEFHGYEGDLKATDLRSSFERYEVDPIVDAPCLLRLESRGSSEAFIVSPLWPDARLPAEPVPSVSCPEIHAPYAPQFGVIDPSGDTLLYHDSETWTLRDLASGVEQPGPGLPEQQILFWGERFVQLESHGSDWGNAVGSTLTVSAATSPYAPLTTLGTPGAVLDWSATSSDVWALTYAGGYDYGERPPQGRHLVRMDPNAPTPELVVLKDLPGSARRVTAFGDRAYIEQGTRLEIVARDGTTLGELTLPSEASSAAASERGFFMTDGDRLWWLAPDAAELALVVDDCSGCLVHGADATRVYTTAHAPRDARHAQRRTHDWLLGYSELRAYDPDGGVLIGRYPIPEVESQLDLLLGNERVVVLTHMLSVLSPPRLP